MEEIIEGNKKIAEFHGAEFIQDKNWYRYDHHSLESFRDTIQAVNVSIESLKYHSSWDWQIPTWSKLAHEIQKFVSERRGQYDKSGTEYQEKYLKILDCYERAVFINEPIEGFKVIVEALEWFNQQSSKQQ